MSSLAWSALSIGRREGASDVFATPRITGPLKTWYDLHQAIAHEVRALASSAVALDASSVGPFVDRFTWFADELGIHPSATSS